MLQKGFSSDLSALEGVKADVDEGKFSQVIRNTIRYYYRLQCLVFNNHIYITPCKSFSSITNIIVLLAMPSSSLPLEGICK